MATQIQFMLPWQASTFFFFPEIKIQLINQDMSCPRKMVVSQVWLGPQNLTYKTYYTIQPNLTSGPLD